MQNYQLINEHYIMPTSAGAYFCVAHQHAGPTRALMQALLKESSSPLLTIEQLQRWTGIDDEAVAIKIVHRAQSLGWLQGLETAMHLTDSPLEDILPDLLAPLSGTGHALLADAEGFFLASAGFPFEEAERLSALSADVFLMYERHEPLLRETLSIDKSAWGIIDAAGNSFIGFWPLWIGAHRFVLVIKDTPTLNRPDLLSLIWALYVRYG